MFSLGGTDVVIKVIIYMIQHAFSTYILYYPSKQFPKDDSAL